MAKTRWLLMRLFPSFQLLEEAVEEQKRLRAEDKKSFEERIASLESEREKLLDRLLIRHGTPPVHAQPAGVPGPTIARKLPQQRAVEKARLKAETAASLRSERMREQAAQFKAQIQKSGNNGTTGKVGR